jgi:hypothetical protein
MWNGLINTFLEVDAHRGFLSRALFLFFEFRIFFYDDEIFYDDVRACQILFFSNLGSFAVLEDHWAFVGLETCDGSRITNKCYGVDSLPNS